MAATPHREEIGENHGEGGLQSAVDDGADAAEKDPAPLGAVHLHEAHEASVRLLQLFGELLLRAVGVGQIGLLFGRLLIGAAGVAAS